MLSVEERSTGDSVKNKPSVRILDRGTKGESVDRALDNEEKKTHTGQKKMTTTLFCKGGGVYNAKGTRDRRCGGKSGQGEGRRTHL